MKTLRQEPIVLKRLNDDEFIPEKLEPNTLYYSKEYNTSLHLCLCGCGVKCCLPIKEKEWSLEETENGVTIKPSIQQLFECRSHYIITKNVANFV